MSLTDAEMLAIFEREVRRECAWTRMTREELPFLVRYTNLSTGTRGGYISWSALTDQTADAEIERQLAHYRALNLEFEWKLYSHDQPSDLGERLLAHGFIRSEPEALMVAGMDDLPAEVWNADTSPVNRVETAAGVDAIICMENAVWGEDLTPIGNGMKYDLAETPDLLSIYAVWQSGRVVSAAWTFYLPPTSFASL